MERRDLSVGMKQRFLDELSEVLPRVDRLVIDEYPLREFRLEQSIDCRGLRYHGARMLWLRMLFDTSHTDTGSTLFEGTRCVVIQEQKVFETLNRMSLRTRKQIIEAVRSEVESYRKQMEANMPSIAPLMDEISTDRFLLMQDMLLRGESDLPQEMLREQETRMRCVDPELFDAMQAASKSEDEDDPSYDDVERVADEQSSDEVLFEMQAEEAERRRQERVYTQSLILDAWRETASGKESDELSYFNQPTDVAINLMSLPHLLPPGIDLALHAECVEQTHYEGEHLWYYDHQEALTKRTPEGAARTLNIFRTLSAETRALLLAQFQEEFEGEVESATIELEPWKDDPLIMRWKRRLMRPIFPALHWYYQRQFRALQRKLHRSS